MSQPLASFQISTSFQNLLDTVLHSIPKPGQEAAGEKAGQGKAGAGQEAPGCPARRESEEAPVTRMTGRPALRRAVPAQVAGTAYFSLAVAAAAVTACRAPRGYPPAPAAG